MNQQSKPNILLFNSPGIFETAEKGSENMVKDLLYGCWCQGKRIAGAEFPPQHFLSLVSVLKPVAKVTIFDPQQFKFTFTVFNRILLKFDWIIIPVAYESLIEDLKWLRYIKQHNPRLKTVIFGSVATFTPEILKEPSIDFGIQGEPEWALLDLISRPLQYHNNTTISPIYHGLDELPIPDRRSIRNTYYFNPLVQTENWTTMVTSRGCPNKCTFCTSPAFYGQKYRFLSPERMVTEIKYLQSLGYREIFFRDETFTTHRSRIMAFCDLLLEEGINLKWICNGRVDTVDISLLQKMKSAGCHTIKFGVESGSQLILDLLCKGISLDQTKYVFKLCKSLGIRTHAHVILGVPGETQQMKSQTINFVKEIEPDTVTFNNFMIVPGSPYFQSLYNNFVNSSRSKQEKTSEELSPLKYYMEQIQPALSLDSPLFIRNAFKMFYIRPKYLLSRLKNIHGLGEFKQLIKSGINMISFILGAS